MPWAVKSGFKTSLQIFLSLEINYTDFHISFDKNWFSRFKSENTSFLLFADFFILSYSLLTSFLDMKEIGEIKWRHRHLNISWLSTARLGSKNL
jgi:hypothetical protein